ncbi:hypothetical protein, partial [uncultured Prevotella sp.]|uniref:hypothetical protein n=1 Tax=uncultured Prevotella sp. TaxID=159272 RepID=UPI00261F388A
LRKTFFSKEQQKNFKFFLRRNIECTSSYELIGLYLFRYAPVTVGSARIIDISLPRKQLSLEDFTFQIHY